MPLNSSKQQVIEHDYDDFKQELSNRFFKAFDDKPIDSAKLKLKGDGKKNFFIFLKNKRKNK